jgi:hypothetical protein
MKCALTIFKDGEIEDSIHETVELITECEKEELIKEISDLYKSYEKDSRELYEFTNSKDYERSVHAERCKQFDKKWKVIKIRNKVIDDIYDFYKLGDTYNVYTLDEFIEKHTY